MSVVLSQDHETRKGAVDKLQTVLPHLTDKQINTLLSLAENFAELNQTAWSQLSTL